MRIRTLLTTGAAVLLILLAPLHVLADSGTPLLWAGTLHLLLGNLLIGILEGRLLAWLYRLKAPRAIEIMIAANYVSMIAGILIKNLFLEPVGRYLTGAALLDEVPRFLVLL